MDSATVTTKCPNCSNQIVIHQVWTPGGMNDYGGFVLKCTGCDHVFEMYLGRDIQDSRVASGAVALDYYDKNVEGDKAATLSKHGLRADE